MKYLQVLQVIQSLKTSWTQEFFKNAALKGHIAESAIYLYF
jgi:hypothetical protein